MGPKYSRRKFLQKSLNLGSAFLSMGLMFIGCQSKKDNQEDQDDLSSVESCSDLSRVSDSEKEKRKVYGYTEQSPYSDNLCSNCDLYLPPEGDNKCGGCILFKGPVHAGGYCDYWASEA
ncbi:MAG: high-potential iron-sulfur protein [Balneolales bacterium]